MMSYMTSAAWSHLVSSRHEVVMSPHSAVLNMVSAVVPS
jgi:hypothetical protein